MERSACLVILALAATLVAGCGNGEERLTASPTRVDFGRMLQGDVSEKQVTLTNQGATDLSILRTAFNCSCFKLHPFGRLLHPGEDRTLTIQFLSGKLPVGPMRGKRLDLVTSDANQPRLQVELAGEIIRSLTVLPSTVDLKMLGDPPSLETQVVQIRPGPGMNVELVRYRAEPADRLEVEVKAVDGGFDLSVRWKPPAEAGSGRFLGSIALRTRVSGAGFEPRELEHVIRVQGEWPLR